MFRVYKLKIYSTNFEKKQNRNDSYVVYSYVVVYIIIDRWSDYTLTFHVDR